MKTLKKLLRKIVELLVLLWSKIYTYHASEQWKVLLNQLYTMWIRNFLSSLGERSRISYPCSLQGGGAKRIHIGNGTSIQSHSILGSWVSYKYLDANHDVQEQSHSPEIYIGDDCNIGEYCQITAINRITIGDGLLTGRYVYIGDNSHGGLSWEEADIPPAKRNLKSKGEIMIGRNVWIGDKVTILAGVTIGDNAIIGANSVVTSNVPSNCVAVGMPAKVVKELKR